MEKTLLFIQGIYDTIDLFVEALSGAFRQMGCTCYQIDIRDEASAMLQLKKRIEEGSIDAIITFNNIGYNLSFFEGKNIWEEQEIPYINILMDHPFHYAYPLMHAPKTSVVFCTDRNHMAFLRRFYPHLKRVDFMPHAGMEADISEYAKAGRCHLCQQGDAYHLSMEERPIDVLYAGGLSKYVAEGLVPDLGAIREFDAFELAQEALADLIQYPSKTTEAAVEGYLRSIGKQYTDKELNHWITELRFIDSYATSFYREQSVRLLVEHGVRVTVFGGGWDRCEWAEHPNLIYGGKVLAPQVLELMNHAKIVLNTMTWYKNGIHDRIINGMLAKAAVVTDMSEYLEEALPGHMLISSEACVPGDHIEEMNSKTYAPVGSRSKTAPCLAAFSLPQIQELPELVQNLLDHPEQMEEIARNGYRYAKAHHTWKQRAEYIYEKYLK